MAVMKRLVDKMATQKMTKGVLELEITIQKCGLSMNSETALLEKEKNQILAIKKKITMFKCNQMDSKKAFIEQNNLVQTLDTWGPDFNIKFDMRIVKLPTGWHNILHYTTGGNQNRIPGLHRQSL